MPTDDNTVKPVDPTAVNMPAPASAPGAVPMTDAPAVGQMPTDMPSADEPKVEETIVPGAAPVAEVPTVGQMPTDLPKPEETGGDTTGGVTPPPAATGM